MVPFLLLFEVFEFLFEIGQSFHDCLRFPSPPYAPSEIETADQRVLLFELLIVLIDWLEVLLSRHLRHCFEQLGQVDDAGCDLLQLVPHRASFGLLLECVALAPIFRIVGHRSEILVYLP